MIRIVFVGTSLLLAACGGHASGPERVMFLEAAAITPLPAGAREIELISPDRACAVDRYQSQVHCVRPDGEVRTLGRPGRGPGEFEYPAHLARGSGGETVIVYDVALSRLSIFAVSGEFVTSTEVGSQGLGRLTRIQTLSDSTVLARLLSWTVQDDVRPVHAELNAYTGAVTWEREVGEDHMGQIECATRLGAGQTKLGAWIPTGHGELLFTACNGEFLLHYTEANHRRPTVVLRSPTYQERFPSEERIRRILEGERRAASSGSFSPGHTPQELRRRPEFWYGARTVDGRRRVWFRSGAGTEKFEREETYLDVYRILNDSLEFRGTVRLDGDVTNIAAVGDRLVAVRNEHDSGDSRTLAWYEIGDLSL
ncbi:hypothetical protein [Candidatus Palauibacter sp.]|uniref:hypothetical protein n=1 Tax=Candidatus Palauibacter sp. TaxID=3101350 RepID=UPI003B5BD454